MDLLRKIGAGMRAHVRRDVERLLIAERARLVEGHVVPDERRGRADPGQPRADVVRVGPPHGRRHCRHLASRFAPPAGVGGGAIGTSRDRNHRYATMSRMSPPSLASGVPFMLRRKQSFTRYSIVSTVALRGRYCGYRAYAPTKEPVARRPSSR